MLSPLLRARGPRAWYQPLELRSGLTLVTQSTAAPRAKIRRSQPTACFDVAHRRLAGAPPLHSGPAMTLLPRPLTPRTHTPDESDRATASGSASVALADADTAASELERELEPVAGPALSGIAHASGSPTAEPAAASSRERLDSIPVPAQAARAHLAPLAVASGLFMEFVDSTALSTALPTLSRVFHSDPVHLKLALTSYLLALAVFAPASGWVADRFGAKRVFQSAMAVFLLGSVLCGLARSLPELVAARLLQGAGGAMMTPVGRVIIVGSTPRQQLVRAMTWFTTPALVGPLLGPPLAGFILGIADWRWIFFINVPIGLLGMAAVGAFAPKLVVEQPGRFDTWGFVLTGIGITTLIVFAEVAGANLAPLWAQLAAAALAVSCLTLYARHAWQLARPILNIRLLSVTSYRASLLGGTLVRLGLGATPFLMPLLLQVGLGWSPAKAGLVTISTAAGAMSCKPVAAPILRRLGFRRTLLWTLVGTAILTGLPAVYREATPVWFMVAGLVFGGFVRSLQFTATNAMAYADVSRSELSQASTLSTVVQQIGMSFGVSFGALVLHLTRGHDEALTSERFLLPFLIVGAITLLAVPVYWRLSPQVGANISGHGQAPVRDQSGAQATSTAAGLR